MYIVNLYCLHESHFFVFFFYFSTCSCFFSCVFFFFFFYGLCCPKYTCIIIIIIIIRIQNKKIINNEKNRFFCFNTKNGGCPLIRACSLIRSNTVIQKLSYVGTVLRGTDPIVSATAPRFLLQYNTHRNSLYNGGHSRVYSHRCRHTSSCRGDQCTAGHMTPTQNTGRSLQRTARVSRNYPRSH